MESFTPASLRFCATSKGRDIRDVESSSSEGITGKGHQKRTCTWNMEHGEEHVGTCSFYMMSMYYEHVEHTEGTC